jgi:thioredoxin reductase (NADPH)
MKKETHDLVIVGAGPAGISAAIYAARYKIDYALVGRIPGGNMTESYDVENYPGLEFVTQGHDLANQMLKQLKRFGGEVKMEEVQSVEKVKGGFKLIGNNTEYNTKKLLLTIGMERNKLNIPGEHELEGRGVAYCATCDGFFYKDKVVAVVGGGDSAVNAALYLSDIAKKVYLIARKDELRAEPTCQDKCRSCKKIEIILGANVKEIKGVERVESVLLDKKEREIKLDGVFIEIGQTPQLVLIHKLALKTNDKDMIVVKGNQRTSVKGVWAAGDITTNSNGLRQIVTAAGEGAVAAVDIFHELKKAK